LRQKTLLGETYVELTPGDRGAGWVPENGTLPAGQVAATVELDEIFRAFDPKTRADFQSWMQNMAIATKGRGRDLSDALGNLAPFAQDTNELLTILNSQEGTVRKLSANTGELFSALSERQGQLGSLIQNSNRVFEVTAKRNKQLQETFVALPAFEKEAKTTVDRLTAFATNADPLITQLRPAARELSPTLTELSALAPDLKALFRDLDPLVTASKAGLPATQQFLDELHPVLAATDPVLAQLNPILSFVGLYKNELNSFFANTVATTQARSDDKVHYLRTTNPLNLEALATYEKRLGSNRANPYQQPGAYRQLKRGLPVFDRRTCGRDNIPGVAPAETITRLLGSNVAQAVDTLLGRRPAIGATGATGATGPTAGARVATSTAAPPCRQSPKFDFGGELTQYPHVNPAPDGSSPSGNRK
ncbi:MAG: MCE family protein, partial [Solirubrobacterales bacterium]|nr:MCE family protein [Solirubrobacterales bacterium]